MDGTGIFRSRTRPPHEVGPVLRASVESGEVYDDPSEDLLFMLFEDMGHSDGSFLIVGRTLDPTGQTYVQSAPSLDGGFVVEYREGGPDRHYATRAPDIRVAHGLVTGWAFELPNWNTGSVWTRVRH
ncbi:hypothetical protein GCM10009710_33620 [Aeromicrobium alkaliterrae]|uniref:Uncharacterized protein n=1 Tax=Aeromicrobium alkaliterrae TaxID=302168 RepID=A0ABP4WFR0_9ACTN